MEQVYSVPEECLSIWKGNIVFQRCVYLYGTGKYYSRGVLSIGNRYKVFQMSVYQFAYVSEECLSIKLSNYLSIYLSIFPSIYTILISRFMGQQAEIPINLDSKSFKITQENIKNPDRSDNLLEYS